MSVCRIALILTWLSAVCACGQSGPLYLPGNPSDVQETPATPPDDGKEDGEDDAAP